MNEAAARAAETGPVPEEERAAGSESYEALLWRLARQSVHKRYEAHRDVDWDAPENQVGAEDPRFELGPDDPLGRSAWYRAQSPSLRARIGLYRTATFMKVGLQFENVLSRGLLAFALARPIASPEHRYAYHELIEESHHSMMFAEFVRRSGLDVPGLDGKWASLGERVARLGASFPELFFVFVLGGEDPIDHAQRRALANGRVQHPLLKRLSQIHVTEEARHLCFARNFLLHHVPRLSPTRRALLSVLAPAILRVTAWLMMRPPRELIARFGVPADVVAAAYDSPEQRASTVVALAKVRALFDELGLITPRTARLWRALGADAATTNAATTNAATTNAAATNAAATNAATTNAATTNAATTGRPAARA